jgi:plastocyanin/glucose/arabinose dehydrogenase
MKNIILLLMIGILLLSACAPAPPPIPEEEVMPEPSPTIEPTATPTEIPTQAPSSEPTPTPTEVPPPFEPLVSLALIASGLTAPVTLIDPDDGTGRLFIIDQVGFIFIIDQDGNLLETPFLDLRDRMVTLTPDYDERGLLGLAFHPDFTNNARFFVYYSAPLRPLGQEGWNSTSTISEFVVSTTDPNLADPDSEVVILEIDQPHHWHNGGSITFGPDGYLYIPLGDGGGAGDTGFGHVDDWYEVNDGGNAQNVEANMLGSILRIDIDSGEPYAIPPDNPGLSENYPEIWAHGFRNPYRIAFDIGGNQELFVGNVGEDLFESVFIAESGGNYGWNVREGSHCFSTAQPDNPEAITDCPREDPTGNPLIDPIIEYQNFKHPDGGIGRAVIGGVVYRGSAIPGWYGRFIFGDWDIGTQSPGSGLFVAERPADGGMWPFEMVEVIHDVVGTRTEYLLSIAQDSQGEVYLLTSLSVGPTGDSGFVYQLIPPEEVDEEEEEAVQITDIEIVMLNNAFHPTEITISAGTTVTWINQDAVIHDVISGSRGDPTDLINSSDMRAGERFSYTFNEPGTYDYFCSYHFGMDATIIVTE